MLGHAVHGADELESMVEAALLVHPRADARLDRSSGQRPEAVEVAL